MIQTKNKISNKTIKSLLTIIYDSTNLKYLTPHTPPLDKHITYYIPPKPRQLGDTILPSATPQSMVNLAFLPSLKISQNIEHLGTEEYFPPPQYTRRTQLY